MPPKPQGRLTSFLIELAESPELLAEFQDDDRRDDLLRRRRLHGNRALRKGATLEEVKAAVAAENPDLTQPILEKWILVGRAPIPND